jgi:hypothetical protein
MNVNICSGQAEALLLGLQNRIFEQISLQNRVSCVKCSVDGELSQKRKAAPALAGQFTI